VQWWRLPAKTLQKFWVALSLFLPKQTITKRAKEKYLVCLPNNLDDPFQNKQSLNVQKESIMGWLPSK